MKHTKLLSKFMLIAAFFAAWGAQLPTAEAQAPSVLINEILYFQDVGSNELNRDHEWIELYNAGNTTINLQNWTITNRTAAPLVTLPDLDLPPDSYLVIHFGTGTDELDFSDNKGNLYTQEDPLTTDHFSETMDEVALYSGAPSAATIVDFLAWKAIDSAFIGGPAHDMAVNAGIWTADEFFNGENAAQHPFEKKRTVFAGDSIGRDQDSLDTNLPADWDTTGGQDAVDMTPCEQNLSFLDFIIPPPPPPQPVKEWTVMVYLDAESNLEPYAFQDMDEMEKAGSDEHVNIVVMVDWHPDFANIKASTDGGLTFSPTDHTWRGFLLPEQDNNDKRVTLYPAPGENGFLMERNMGDPAEITEFVNWGVANFPAQKYALVLWDHGLGWKANLWDESTDPEDEIHMGELDDALAATPVVLDLIGFDECLMAMIEVAYQVYDHANVFVGSQELESAYGWPYEPILKALKSNPAMTGSMLGGIIVAEYHKFYETVKVDKDHTQSAVSLDARFLDLRDFTSDFAAELTAGIEDYDFNFGVHFDPDDNVQIKIQEELDNTEDFDDANYIDLSHFAELIDANNQIPNNYKVQAPRIVNLMAQGAGIVIANEHGDNHTDAHGLSIYFPSYQSDYLDGDPFDDPDWSHVTNSASPQVRYAPDPDDCLPMPNPQDHLLAATPNFHFPADTEWDEFLHRYYEPVADAGENIIVFAGQPFMLDGSGSSDADGLVTRWIWDVDALIDSDADDVDKDCVNEANDDNDLEGETVLHTFFVPGVYTITLTVWDNHHLLGAHAAHPETDQDDILVVVLEEFFVDCERNEFGHILPGTPCDDGDPTTFADTITPGCECAGIPSLCTGIGDEDGDGVCADKDCDDLDPNVTTQPGDACDDLDPTTIVDTVVSDCTCAGAPTVCTGIGDTDEDGVCEDTDNCPELPNPAQFDRDFDSIGDTCDICPFDPENDIDGDGICGDIDNCPFTFNPDQTDENGNGIGDLCDPEAMDTDGDGVPDILDNCPNTINPDQADSDCDEVGDSCDLCPGGDDRIDTFGDPDVPDCAEWGGLALLTDEQRCSSGKVRICQLPRGNINMAITICVDPSAVPALLSRGNFIGPCHTQQCDEPEDKIDFTILDTRPEKLPEIDPGFGGFGLRLYPNPASQILYLDMSLLPELPTELIIYDALGKEVYRRSSERYTPSEIAIQFSANDMKAGLYTIVASTSAGMFSEKFIISRR